MTFVCVGEFTVDAMYCGFKQGPATDGWVKAKQNHSCSKDTGGCVWVVSVGGLSTCLQTAPLSGPFDLNTEPALLSQSETGSLVIL